MIFSSSYGGITTYPCWRTSSSALARRSLDATPTSTISAPSASVAARLIAGAFDGITITAFAPTSRAA